METASSEVSGRSSVEPVATLTTSQSSNCASAVNENTATLRHSSQISPCLTTIPRVPTPTLVSVPSAPLSLIHHNLTSPPVAKKILSKNHNNTIFATSYPNNLAELQLYRVMQNASLLVYYDTLLEMGGDDVQQLCDAGEEEFLEIMSLVGMASKPLHVRRLQKSLQEWVTNPTKFKVPLTPGDDYEIELSSTKTSNNHGFFSMATTDSSRTLYSPSPVDICSSPQVVSPGLPINKRPFSPLDPVYHNSSAGSSALLQLTPSLTDSQISKLATAAEKLSKSLPQFEPKPHNTKKKVCKELEIVMSMPDNDPRRLDEIRRYAAIYGRFDCKRKPEKPLTLHEVSVNEAAAQICRFIPALLTRRDELFPLARQVVKDSGCYYSKTQLSSLYMNKSIGQDKEILDNSTSLNSRSSPRIHTLDGGGPTFKKRKIEPQSDDDGRQESKSAEAVVIISPLHSLFQHNVKSNYQASRERSSVVDDFEDEDCHFSFSSSSSPPEKEYEDQEQDEDASKYSPKVKVIAASGDNIIAVANPALAMSPTINVGSLIESKESNHAMKKTD